MKIKLSFVLLTLLTIHVYSQTNYGIWDLPECFHSVPSYFEHDVGTKIHSSLRTTNP